MAIDIIVMVFLAMAIFKGLKSGLVVAVFSFVGIVLGAAAALRLSAKVAEYLAPSMTSISQWLPFISFLMVFLVVVIAVRFLAKMIEASLQWSMLGWANKLGGVLFFVLIYCMIISIGLFYADKLGLVSATTKTASKSYPLLQPLAPVIMNTLGAIIPWFSDLFGQIESAFDQIGKKIP